MCGAEGGADCGGDGGVGGDGCLVCAGGEGGVHCCAEGEGGDGEWYVVHDMEGSNSIADLEKQ